MSQFKDLLSKDYAKERAKLINRDRNDPRIRSPVILIHMKEKQILTVM
jgi:hypothetical protein